VRVSVHGRVWAACAAMLIVAPSIVRADRLLLAHPDPALTAAVEVAMEPWGVRVESVPALAPGDPHERGRAAARASDAPVVVWIEGASLFVFEARTDRLHTRPLDREPPFDPATAASIALALKTLLRHGPLDPRASPAPAPAPRAPEWALAFAAGARFWASVPAWGAPRLALDAAFWPVALGHNLGIGVRLDSGTGVAFARGRWFDAVLALVVEVRSATTPLDVGLILALGAQVTALDVTLDGDRSSQVWRFNPHGRAEVSVGVQPATGLRFALRAGVEGPLLRQRYLLRGEPVLEIGPAALSIQIATEIALH
jgi:hypothetical protein